MEIKTRAESLIDAIALSQPIGEKFFQITAERIGIDFDSLVLDSMIKKQGAVMILNGGENDRLY